MEIDLTTLLLELLNFLILVWLLKRFLYRPVLNVIERRRQSVQASLTEAERIRRDADTARERYERRLADWEKERELARENLRGEIRDERARLLEALRNELEDEHRKASARREQEAAELRRRQTEDVRTRGVKFAGGILSRLAGPELEQLLVLMAIEDLGKLPPGQLAELSDDENVARVWTAYPLPESLRKALEQALGGLAVGNQLNYQYRELPEILAGLRVQLGPWLLQANLRDELQFFAESGRDVT